MRLVGQDAAAAGEDNARGGAHKVQSVVTNVGLFGFERTIDYPKK